MRIKHRIFPKEETNYHLVKFANIVGTNPRLLYLFMKIMYYSRDGKVRTSFLINF